MEQGKKEGKEKRKGREMRGGDGKRRNLHDKIQSTTFLKFLDLRVQ